MSHDLPLSYKERRSIELFLWDEYKSVHGVRPRWINFDDLSDEKLIRMADELSEEIRRQCEAQRAHNALVAEARANPHKYVVEVSSRFDMNDIIDREYIEECEKFGDFSHLVVMEIPKATIPTMGTVFEGVLAA